MRSACVLSALTRASTCPSVTRGAAVATDGTIAAAAAATTVRAMARGRAARVVATVGGSPSSYDRLPGELTGSGGKIALRTTAGSPSRPPCDSPQGNVGPRLERSRLGGGPRRYPVGQLPNASHANLTESVGTVSMGVWT